MSRHKSNSGYSRTERVADQMQKELAELLRLELKDPRVGMVTVSGVDVTRDFAFADVHFTLLETGDLSPAEIQGFRQETLDVLKGAAGFLRSELAQRIKLRVIPQLRFHYDKTIELGSYLESLMKQAEQKDQSSRHSGDDTDTTET